MQKNVYLLRSRKFWIAVAIVLADAVVYYVPQLAEVQDELVKVITAVGALLIASITAEDVAFFWGANQKR